ncbi:MAG: IclR family transcriptional regulator [Alphaproteobacteria bacterium]|jgi:DNA-binding IclR family transcriptional regulator|nr:transcriptional regulator [Rhodospirillaceae bacterium]MDP6023757.1 IclR family transcriptional regulator [Alphaproteobacteria bacterium]MDP6255281.1 IclR family transcriptional regulator [Alphaproteobacteria bacterium]MDP7052849.1 IclR family transcriptional regulator [Alphaproteobacteria bacterium]MDP7229113.1 IclR family transcriptional regulator [Alphaproteobacteria bacterium]|tara:strand:- start:231 stop:1025 length:795 start_codon:yes stop_codon:yes gene_type:complete
MIAIYAAAMTEPNDPQPAAPARPVTAVSRAATILRYLGRSQEPLGVSRIARDLELIPSTALNILRTLVHEDLVVFEPNTKRYSLGIGILGIARDMLGGSDFVQAMQSHLENIAATFDVAAIAVELDSHEHMVVVALARPRLNLSIHVNIGSQFPALISATGRCVAAQRGWDRQRLARSFEALRWQNPPAFETWLDEIEAARRDGYAIDDGNYIRGIVIIAAPISQSAGAPSRAVVAVGLAAQLDDGQRQALARRLRAVVDGLAD